MRPPKGGASDQLANPGLRQDPGYEVPVLDPGRGCTKQAVTTGLGQDRSAGHRLKLRARGWRRSWAQGSSISIAASSNARGSAPSEGVTLGF
jgi:hypothetical protein